jgi:hypothetical protein
MICGVPVLSRSHPAVIPAPHATQQIAPTIPCGLFDCVCTISSNRHRNSREDPIRQAAPVVVENGEAAAFKADGRVAAETPFETAAN